MTRPRDLSFETLAGACGIDITQLTGDSRGVLNRALAQIRAATPDLEDAELAIVIEGKANTYRKVMAGAILTPTALAKHWPQLDGLLAEQAERERAVVQTNRPVYDSDCVECGGLRLVLEGHRPAFPSLWAIDRRSPKNPNLGMPHPQYRRIEDGYEEYLPCPVCSSSVRVEVLEYQRRFSQRHPQTVARKLDPSITLPTNKRSSREEE